MISARDSGAWLLVGCLAAASGSLRADDLFLPPAPAVGGAPDDPAGVPAAAVALPEVGLAAPTLRQRLARVDRDLLERVRAAAASGDAPAGLLDLNLFEDAVFRVTDLEIGATSAGYSITGKIEGVAYGTVAIVVNGPEIAGSVRTPAGAWSIEGRGDGEVVIRQIDEDALPGQRRAAGAGGSARDNPTGRPRTSGQPAFWCRAARGRWSGGRGRRRPAVYVKRADAGCRDRRADRLHATRPVDERKP